MKERKGAPKGVLMALGGEADGAVDESCFSMEGELADEAAYQPRFDPMTVFGSTVQSMGDDIQTLDMDYHTEEPDDDVVDRVAQALLREYLNKRKMKEVLAMFDAACERRDDTISSRRQLRTMLQLGEPVKPQTVLEQIIAQRMADVEHGSPHMLGDQPTDTPKPGFSFRKRPDGPAPPGAAPPGGYSRPTSASTTQSRTGISKKTSVQAKHVTGGVILGAVRDDGLGLHLSDGAIKLEGGFPSRKTMLCDMKTNKIIDHLGDLDFTHAEKLGSGAGGTVYTAVHKPTGVEVAVKFVQCDEQKYKEISQELEILFKHQAQGQCPYIVSFHGSFFQKATPAPPGVVYATRRVDQSHEDRIAVVLERMMGSLNDCISVPGAPMVEDAVQAAAWQALNGLCYLHKSKIIHRDLKPHNILFNGKGEVKVTDFGVSSGVKTVDGDQAETFVGTMIFMSPERCIGAPYSFDADVWALGLCVYNLIMNRKPYANPSGGQVGILSIVEGAEPRIHPDFPVSQQCRDFVARCVVKDPRRRPTAEALKQDPWMVRVTDGSAKLCFEKWVETTMKPALQERAMRQSGSTINPADTYKALDMCLVDGDV
eukprot:TRINITY_DN22113_c0_g1_i1.p1 TRINITY_DN22113_c0_g1~~TRINITY_DN22113_c0_g1_i1.p1  ORF type:complete len:597 (+),score=151.57 TRINITY_DN22113_c0_g1_i1:118-1908(+)